MRYLGEDQRPVRLTYCEMNCARDFASSSTPQKSLPVPFPTGFEKPVPIGSMNTMSVTSIKLFALSTVWYGGGGVNAASVVTTRRGPNAPMCSQAEAEPGPPLKMKAIGRWLGSLASVRVYAV